MPSHRCFSYAYEFHNPWLRATRGRSWATPGRYGPWETVYGLFRRWHRDGT